MVIQEGTPVTTVNMTRRDFNKAATALAGLALTTSIASAAEPRKRPSYLDAYAELYKSDPRKAAQDIKRYVEFMNAQVTELLTNYGPIAAIWLDGIGSAKPLKKHTQQLYDLVHRLQPQVLVSYKQGFLGTEDFMAPERHFKGKPTKPLELCNTMQGYSWGYDRADEGRHRDADEVMKMLDHAGKMPANLLLNTGPLPDGSIHPVDVKTLAEVGKRLRENKR